MESGDYLFVYGTLRSGSGDPVHQLTRNYAIFVGTGVFRGKLYDLGRYPGAVPSSGAKDRVLGEVYRLTNSRTALKILDAYEGRRFKRKRVTIRKEQGQRVSAWIYLYVGTVKRQSRIHSGDYLDYHRHSR